MKAQHSKGFLCVAHRFAVRAELAFDAWLDPRTAGGWLFATPRGRMIRVEIDARVGGKFTIVRRDGEDIEHVGEYLEIDRPRRLAFSFAVPKFSSEFIRVVIDIISTDGGCELVLTHERVLPDWIERTRQGWKMILEGLEASLTEGR